MIIDTQLLTQAYENLMAQFATTDEAMATKQSELATLENEIKERDKASKIKAGQLTNREKAVEAYEEKVAKDKSLYQWEVDLKGKEQALSDREKALSIKETELAGVEKQSQKEAERLRVWAEKLSEKEAKYKEELEAKVLQQMKDNLFNS